MRAMVAEVSAPLAKRPTLEEMVDLQVRGARNLVSEGENLAACLIMWDESVVSTFTIGKTEDPMGAANTLISERRPLAYTFLCEVWFASFPKGADLSMVKRGDAARSPNRIEGVMVGACKNGDDRHIWRQFTIDRVNRAIDESELFEAATIKTRLPLSW